MEKKIYTCKDYEEGRIPFKVTPAASDTHENLSFVCRPEDNEFLMSLGRTLLAIQEADKESRRCKKKMPSSGTYDHKLTLLLDGKNSYTLEDGPVFKKAVYDIFNASTIDIDYYFSWYGDYYNRFSHYYYNLIPITLDDIAEDYKDRVNFTFKEIYGDPCGDGYFSCWKIENGTVVDSEDCKSPDIINYKSEYGWSDMSSEVVAFHTAVKYPELLKKLRDITCEYFPQDAVNIFKKHAWEEYAPEVPAEYDDSLDPHALTCYCQTYFKDLKDYQEYLDAIYKEMTSYFGNNTFSENGVELMFTGNWAQFDTFTVAEWEVTEDGPRPVGVHF